ncbi:hypothetical protein [Clostridium beijerinckii]|uniref:hypothetical protein n=1 Tax=Clostridium beijerinckii TaxID=1520 RepID=UPI002330EE72|nr:hypothetical protein [Clostridium beijerinckii]
MDTECALMHIKKAYILAIASGIIGILLTILSVLGIWNLGLDLYELLEVIIIFGLAFGISKKSRVCAIILFFYYIINKIIILFSNGSLVGLAIMIFFTIEYFQGIRGTIHYHKNLKLERINNENLSK